MKLYIRSFERTKQHKTYTSPPTSLNSDGLSVSALRPAGQLPRNSVIRGLQLRTYAVLHAPFHFYDLTYAALKTIHYGNTFPNKDVMYSLISNL